MAGQPLKSGRYLVQQMTSAPSFITIDTIFSSPDAEVEPVVALPPGVVASVVSFLSTPLTHFLPCRLMNMSIHDLLVGVQDHLR
jgi:hypothetical protein